MTLGQIAKAYGIGKVVMVGTRQGPLDIALEVQAADHVIVNSEQDPVEAVLDLTDGEGADVVFETVGGNAPTLNQAIGMSRRGAIISILGVFVGNQDVDVVTAYSKELTIQWSNSYSQWQGVPEYKMALDILTRGQVDPSPFISSHYPLEQIGEAFVAADDKRSSGAVKVMVHPWQ